MVKVFSQLFQSLKYSLCCKWVVCCYSFWNPWFQSFVDYFCVLIVAYFSKVTSAWNLLSIFVQVKDDGRDGKREWLWSPPLNFTVISLGNKIQKPSTSDSDVPPLTNILVTGVSEDQSWIINFLFLWRLACRVEWCRQRNHKRPTEVIAAWLPVLLNLSLPQPDWGERSSSPVSIRRGAGGGVNFRILISGNQLWCRTVPLLLSELPMVQTCFSL